MCLTLLGSVRQSQKNIETFRRPSAVRRPSTLVKWVSLQTTAQNDARNCSKVQSFVNFPSIKTHLWQHKIIYALLRGQSSGFGISSTKGQPGLRKRSHKQVMPPEYDRLDHYVQCSGRGRYEISRAWLWFSNIGGASASSGNPENTFDWEIFLWARHKII